MAIETRHVHLVSPLDKDQLLLQRARLVEELGRPFEYELHLLSPDPALKFDKLLGDKMTVVLDLPEGERFFNGHVARIGQGGKVGRYTRYTCTLRPHLWLLTRASDSRIFKKMTVPDIVKQIISEFGIGELEAKLQGSYPVREYTVMYRESYFDFISRLLEEEGIYYWFRHEKDRHLCVLCDDPASHAAAKDSESIPFIDPEVNADPREEHFSEWSTVQEVASGAFEVNDFDFEVPKADLRAKTSRKLPHKHSELEMYDPLAGFVEALDAGNGGDTNRGERGELFARVRLEELQAEFDRSTLGGNPRDIGAGVTFALTGHPRDDQNRELLVIRAEYRMFQPGFDAGSAGGRDSTAGDAEGSGADPLYRLRILTQPAKTPFRPRRTTPRPVIAGPHAGLVVGQGEIWTDKLGRVKVHFPWDREDMEGCWVRVSQGWAGGAWGSLQIPRVGQEVIVEFVEGDPDRPLITGRAYNGTNGTPFGLPDGATMSGILTRSTPGGSADNANELRFQDKKGAEQVFIHAEKNMDTEVENDQTHAVGHDRTRTVGNDEKVDVSNDQAQTIGNNQTEKVGANQKLEVGSNQTISVGADRTDSVTANETRTVGGDRSRTVSGSETVTVYLQRTHTVGINESITIGAAQEITIGGNQAVKIGVNQSTDVGKDQATTVGKNQTNTIGEGRTTAIGKDDSLDVKKKLTINAGDEISITTGSASIVLKKDGTITIKGKDITIEGSGTITAKASKDMTLKGKKILQN